MRRSAWARLMRVLACAHRSCGPFIPPPPTPPTRPPPPPAPPASGSVGPLATAPATPAPPPTGPPPGRTSLRCPETLGIRTAPPATPVALESSPRTAPAVPAAAMPRTSRNEEPSLRSKRHPFGSSVANAEVLAQLVEGGTEPGGRRETPEAQHRVVPLLDGSVALLGQVVQVSIASVPHLPPQDPADRAAVGRMGIGGDALRLGACHIDEPPQEASRGVLVAVLAEHRIEEVAIAVDGAVEVGTAESAGLLPRRRVLPRAAEMPIPRQGRAAL